MVGRKKLGHGSRGRQVPTMPRVPNSARGKRSTRRKNNDMHAFDLLATVARTLLVDRDTLSNVHNTNGAETSYTEQGKPVKQKLLDDIAPLKNLAMEKDCCSISIVGSGGIYAFPNQANVCLAENSSTRNEAESVLDLLALKSNGPCERDHGLGLIPECGAFGVRHLGSTSSAEAEQVQEAEPEVMKSQADEHARTIDSLFDSVDLDGRPPALVSSDSNSGVPLCSQGKELKSSSLCQDEVQHTAKRDDDENFSGCIHPSTRENKGYKPHYRSDHRIRKLFASKARKAARTKICGGVSSKGRKLNFCGRKISTIRQKMTIFKRKKLAWHQVTTSSVQGMPIEASGTSFAIEDQNKSCESEDYHVKLRIKSIKIPELFIGIPENATVGSLKRTVMDVISSIMEGSLRIGVLLQGKNIQDDNMTLCQAGICHGAKLNNIDFTLESEALRDSSSGLIMPEDMDFSNADIVEPLARMKFEAPFHGTKYSDDNQQPMQSYPNCSFAGPGSVRCPVEMASQDISASYQAIIPVTPAGLDALAIVPLCKSRWPETGQRRMRRPFSVGEVEALVEAVELLGTGRWRDVKMHAFENTDHRTYVDLKDKWKTLVHTANISPQQRRGTQVPQELLDRVLAAQAYWSQQQAKHQDKTDLPSLE